MTQSSLFSPAWQHAECLRLIAAATSGAPASIEYLSGQTGMDARAVKQAVADERVAGAPICARRGRPNGYYWATEVSQLEESASVMRNQAKSMLLAAGRLVGRHRLAEMLGQLTTEVLEGEQTT